VMKMTPFHEAANLFPMMDEDELKALAEDIKKHGLQQAIVLLDGQVLDGRNRLKACALAGVKPDFTTTSAHALPPGGSPVDFVVSANLHRRHLTGEQKRAVIAAVLKAAPAKSNRQVAGQVKVDHKTVGTVRDELEAVGEIPQQQRVTGRNGKTFKARKPKPEGRGEFPHVETRRDATKEAVAAAQRSVPAPCPPSPDDSAISPPAEEEGKEIVRKRWHRLSDFANTLHRFAREARQLASREVANRKTADVRAFVQRLHQEADRVEREVLLAQER
jgi:hypothetical protein